MRWPWQQEKKCLTTGRQPGDVALDNPYIGGVSDLGQLWTDVVPAGVTYDTNHVRSSDMGLDLVPDDFHPFNGEMQDTGLCTMAPTDWAGLDVQPHAGMGPTPAPPVDPQFDTYSTALGLGLIA